MSRFGFTSGIFLLIAPGPVHCFSTTFRPNGFREEYFFIFSNYKPMVDNDAPGA